MKNLKFQTLGDKQMLTKAEMQKINGGIEPPSGCDATASCTGAPDVYCEITGPSPSCYPADGEGAMCYTDDDINYVRCPH